MTKKDWLKLLAKRRRQRELERRRRQRERLRVLARDTRQRQRERARQERLAKIETEKLRMKEASRCTSYYRAVAFQSAKQYAKELILWVTRQENGRDVGMSYDVILDLVRRRFPVITYNGPHTGKPIGMTVKQLREIAYSMQSIDRALRFPVRPRSKRKAEPLTSVSTPAPKKVEHVT